MKPIEIYGVSLFDERNDIIPKGLNNQMRLFLSGAPIVGGMVRSEDNWNYANDYLRNTGLGWSDVKYPTHVTGMPALGSLAGGLSFVSENINKLYE